jgi:heme/copper-type cytochrome/quinol oxidase subunit 2
VTEVSPVLSLICGLLVAGTVHTVKSVAVRPLITASTAGMGDPIVSTAEDVVATLISVLSIVLPVLMLIVLVLLIWALIALIRRLRKPAQEYNQE